ncbi:MAG: STAS domain-containing protein [candidate division Zixibacteria bacterium]
MEIITSIKDQVNVLSMRGKLDLANAAKLKETVKTILDEKRNMIHLDMKDVDFINSSGLGALVSLMKEIRVQKGRLTLSNLAPYVNEIFEITQLSHVFEIFPTSEEAITSYQTACSTGTE